MFRISKSIETNGRWVVTKGWGMGWKMTPMSIEFLFRVMKIFWD
jgi:hypothetical protein